MRKYKHTILILFAIAGYNTYCQQIDFLVTEYNQSIYQTGETTYIGMTEKSASQDGWNWPSYSFFAAVDIATESFSSVTLSGPSFLPALQIPWAEFGYEAYIPLWTMEELTGQIQPGTHTFNMDGLTEDTSIPAYTPLTTRLVKNYDQWQSFDPGQELVLSWEEFTEGQGQYPDGTPMGFIEVYIEYWDDTYGSQYAWSHWDLDPSALNTFDALPATTTSVTIPADTLIFSQYGYTVSIFFLKIDSFEDGVNATGAIVGNLRTMDTLLEIWPKTNVDPWLNYPDLGNGWIDTGAWMGLLNLNHAPWIYAADSAKYLYIPDDGVSIGSGAWTWVPVPPDAP